MGVGVGVTVVGVRVGAGFWATVILTVPPMSTVSPTAFDSLFAARLEEADEFYRTLAPADGDADAAAVMRHHFLKVLQTTPTAYRRLFGMRVAS